MTWISLICLLALSSTAFGRAAYGGSFGPTTIPQMSNILSAMRDQNVQRPFLSTLPVASQGYGQPQPTVETPAIVVENKDLPIQPIVSNGYGSSFITPTISRTLPVQGYGQNYGQGYGQGYGATPRIQFDQTPVAPVPELTPADLLCRGQVAETIIPIENNRKFVVCLSDSKGVEQQCPKGLFYHEQSRRCERQLGPPDNICASQPCLNGGQCVPTDSWFQCQCAPGFDGKTCELDARVCQQQYPCGQSPDARCQSFRLGAALQYICILQDGYAYGLNPTQAYQSPCRDTDGPHALVGINGGFIMCDGERMFVESCPGGTIWDDLNKACVWPDMQSAPSQLDQPNYVQSSYGASIVTPKVISSYGQAPAPRIVLDVQRPVDSYSAPSPAPRIVLDQPRPVDSYGASLPAPRIVLDQPRPVDSYGAPLSAPRIVLDQPRPVDSYGAPMTAPRTLFDQSKPVDSYGAPLSAPRISFDQSKPVDSYGAPMTATRTLFDQSKPVDSYGAGRPDARVITSFDLPRPHHHRHMMRVEPKVIDSYGGEQRDFVPSKPASNY
jgi:hypothetical protein